MRPIDSIILHCSATPEGANFHAADIDRWHRRRGFAQIGYHYVIDLDGTIETGRPENIPGAHCQGHNLHSIGICYIGGLATDGHTPKDTRTPEQTQALLALLRTLRTRYPSATIHGHNEFAPKACPAFDVQQWLKQTPL